MAWPAAIRTEALVACQRSCCLCHKFCGVRIELHHIVSESKGGPSDLDNCIPLCFDCHAEVEHYNSAHPRGTKFSIEELKLHRSKWFERVSNSGDTIVSSEHRAIDQRIAREIHEFMTRNGSYGFLRDDSIKSEFRRSPVLPLYELSDRLENPDFEFFDSDLESLRVTFAMLLSRSISEIGRNTQPVLHDPEWSTGSPAYWMEQKDYEVWYAHMSDVYELLRQTALAYFG